MLHFVASTLPRAIGAFAFVWMLAPHQPDLGFGRPQTIETLIADPDTSCGAHNANCGNEMFGAVLHAVGGFERSHQAVLDGVERVRADLAHNRTR